MKKWIKDYFLIFSGFIDDNGCYYPAEEITDYGVCFGLMAIPFALIIIPIILPLELLARILKKLWIILLSLN